jgi:hypothetical protein
LTPFRRGLRLNPYYPQNPVWSNFLAVAELFAGDAEGALATSAHALASQIGVGKFDDGEFWFGGASIVSYALFDETGALKKAGTNRNYKLMKLLKDGEELVHSSWGR